MSLLCSSKDISARFRTANINKAKQFDLKADAVYEAGLKDNYTYRLRPFNITQDVKVEER